MAKTLEVGKPYGFNEVKNILAPEDMNLNLKAVFVVQGKMGSLIALRDLLDSHMVAAGGELVYGTITAQSIYAVHWNDLSVEKQKSIERKQKK